MSQFARLFAESGLSLDRLHTFLEVAEAGNIAKAAGSDPNRQSQFSRQVKELEGFFGSALTRRVGRRIAITEEGLRLAAMIRQQFLDLDRFREVAKGRTVNLRIGASGSVIQWMLTPRLEACRGALGGARLDLVQSRSREVVGGVADGRLDLGIVRSDALPSGAESLPLVAAGYSLFYPSALVPKGGRPGVKRLLSTLPMAMLLPGGRFETDLEDWLAEQEIQGEVVARVSSFLAAAAIVSGGEAAAVLPDLAVSGFGGSKIARKPLPWDYRRDFAILWNVRSLDRVEFGPREMKALAGALRGKAGHR